MATTHNYKRNKDYRSVASKEMVLKRQVGLLWKKIG